MPIARLNVHANSVISLAYLTAGCSYASTKKHSGYMQAVMLVVMHHDVNLARQITFLPVNLEEPASLSCPMTFSDVAGVEQAKSCALLLFQKRQTSQLPVVDAILSVMPRVLHVPQLVPKASVRTFLIHEREDTICIPADPKDIVENVPNTWERRNNIYPSWSQRHRWERTQHTQITKEIWRLPDINLTSWVVYGKTHSPNEHGAKAVHEFS